jgi:amino acid adenylation domain-containing protein
MENRDWCLHRIIEKQAERTPDTVAVVCGNRRLTYRDLNAGANFLARRMRESGVKTGVPVGVYMEHSPELLIAVLAVLKAGGVCVPLEPTYPEQRLALMLQDCRPHTILVHEPTARRLPPQDAHVVCVNENDGHAENPDCDVSERELAFIVYTSGTTGRPKGVMQTHRNIAVPFTWFTNFFALTPADSDLMKTPISLAGFRSEFFFPLSTGGRVIVLDNQEQKDLEKIVGLIAGQHVTMVRFTPTMLREFLRSPDLQKCRSLRYVLSSGEPLSLELQRRFFECLEAKLYNGYGTTEAPGAVHRECKPGEKGTHYIIGHPLPMAKVYVLAPDLQKAPVGQEGEICIGGDCVARGYLNHPELTAERFPANPFSESHSDRLYRSGDKGRFLADGTIEFLGRMDMQVKFRGMRVDLNEIESACNKQPGIRESAVVVHEDDAGKQRLVAYVVSDSPVLATSELRRALSETLPDYMIPAVFVCLETFPMTPNGKIDRGALASGKYLPQKEKSASPPSTPMEKAVANLWAQILGLEHGKVGLEDNFFDLGGDSLRIVQFIAWVRKDFGVELSMEQHFVKVAPTISLLVFAILKLQLEQDNLAGMLEKIEGLSEEEARAARVCEEQAGGEK